MATTTDHSAFDLAPAFIEVNGAVVYKGTVAALREATGVSALLGMAVRQALLDCVELWLLDRKPTEPRPLCERRTVIDWAGFCIRVGVGDA